jgi:pyruvate dehydrogenase E1 component beta subunit
MMYGVTMSAPDHVMDKDFVLPLNKAKIEKEGTDVTITAFSKMVGFSLEAAAILQKEYGINAEVINLRVIRPLDRNTIVESVKKTNRIVSVEEGWPQSGVGSEIAALMMESEAFDYLDAPLERIAGADVPMPYSVSIERLAVPQVDNIVKGALKACFGKKK